MSHYITCPRCHASLKANKIPLTNKTVACPECQQPFQVAGTGVTINPSRGRLPATPTDGTVDLPIATPSGSHWVPLGIIASILLVGGGIVAAIVFTRHGSQPNPTPPVFVAQEQDNVPKVDPEQEKVAEKALEQRRERFTNLMIEGGTSFNTQQYEDALQAYTEAVTLFPENVDVKNKLREVQATVAKLRQLKQDEAKLRDDAIVLAKQGQTALEDKQYPAAIDFFKLALQKDASLSEASQGLMTAQAAVQRAQLDKKKIDEYEQFILSGKAAQKAGRYADAIREFMSAERAVPNDQIAKQLQREAEKQLDGLLNRAEKLKELQRLLDQGNAALKNKAFDDAEKAFQRALRLDPNHADALQGLDESQKKLKTAKLEYAKWMFNGNAAANASRFNEAVLSFREATRLFPNDETAAKALRLAELSQDSQTVYFRAMERGGQAMTLKQFGDAVVAFNEALRAAPGSPLALQGLADAQRAFEADVARRREFERKASAGVKNLKQQRYAEASADLRAALKVMGHHPDARVVERQLNYADAMAKAVAALNARRFSDAIAQFQAALEVFPNDFAANAGLKQARQLNNKAGNK